jgi:hypothetical protein
MCGSFVISGFFSHSKESQKMVKSGALLEAYQCMLKRKLPGCLCRYLDE